MIGDLQVDGIRMIIDDVSPAGVSNDLIKNDTHEIFPIAKHILLVHVTCVPCNQTPGFPVTSPTTFAPGTSRITSPALSGATT